MANTMNVSLVAADRQLWSGEATVVNTRTIAGEIGILANHTPLLSVLEPGQVDVRTADDGHWVAAIDGGFISVANNQVSILCDFAEMSHESDFEEAKRKLDERKAAEAPEHDDDEGDDRS
jgi:F-type H+-transporting ATPase subunit epsilon